MPVPQISVFLWYYCRQQARCLFHKYQFSCGTIVGNRQDACSTKYQFSCGTGILPVHRMLVENGIIL
ncbi:hypothetical protein [Tychonema bourrellyi]|uniref:hypothetical protein n=1 Tax=Tychonema bourrellyi TaxID=54313 RepID=UPI00117C3624|nr:hypothetical protein [Tychonema bourrellyi]